MTTPPTADELRQSVAQCFYAATQCCMYHYWSLLARPRIEENPELVALEIPKMMSNGVTEATLMFFRKTHEFFKQPAANDRNDTLFAYRWNGFAGIGDVYDPTVVVNELHKRVGHLTVREARLGKVEWQVFAMSVRAVERWITFFDFLVEYYTADTEMRDYCAHATSALKSVLEKMKSDVQRLAAKDVR